MPAHNIQAIDALVAELRPPVDEGQRALALTMRHVLHRTAPELFASLDFDDDATFLDPLAFLHFSTTPSADPAAVYARVRYGPRLSRHGVELVVERHPLLDTCFVTEAGTPVHAAMVGGEPGVEDALRAAFAALERAAPSASALIGDVGRLVVVFRDARLNSFATPRAHGVAFLNAAYGISAPGFVDDLSHQFGHTLFTAAAGDGTRYLTLPADLPLGKLTGEPRDERPLLVALHGLVTESLIVGVLDRCVAVGAFAGDDGDEAIGRLAFVGRRLGIDLGNFAGGEALTDEGTRLLERMRTVLAEALGRHAAAMRTVNLDGQGYNFDLAAFREANARRTEVA